jgi:hypothetical protein
MRIEQTHEVKLGTYWEDADCPGWGRVVKVMAVDDTHAEIMTLVNERLLQGCVDRHVAVNSGNKPMDMRGRVRQVTLDRFRPTADGFLYLDDGPAEIKRRDAEDEKELESFLVRLTEPERIGDGEPVMFKYISLDETFRL